MSVLDSLHRPMPYNAWISPDGVVHHVGLWGHAEFAIDWLKEHDNVSIENRYEKGTEILHERGWARIFTRSEGSYAQVITSDRHPSRKIYEGIYAAYIECGYPEIWDWLREEGYIQTLQVEGKSYRHVSPK